MPILKSFVLFLAIASASAVDAQDPPSTVGSDDIVVTGVRDSTIDLKRLLKAEAVFRAGRPTYAPSGTLRFQLRPTDGLVVEGIKLTLRRGDESISLPVDAEGRFTLPPMSLSGWELYHNRGKRSVFIRALVLSPGTDESNRLLGDLRLQCRVGWELTKEKFAFFVRSAFAVAGGCSSSRIAFYNVVLRPVAGARISDGVKNDTLPIGRNQSSYRAPLADRKWSNSARVQLAYR